MQAFVNKKKQQSLCEKIVPRVKARRPNSTFDLVTCTDGHTEFNIHRANSQRMELYVGRNLHDVGAGYFSCSATVGRKSNRVTQLSCEVR